MKKLLFILSICTCILAISVKTQANVFSMPSGQTSLQLVTVGDPGNGAHPYHPYGAVSYTYKISKFEVTQGQYCQFLNAKAASVTYYNTPWCYNDPANPNNFGIIRSGSQSSYTYSVTAGYENKPMIYVSWYDTIRFVNWLTNGQGNGDTETGAYTITTDSNGTVTGVTVPSASQRAAWAADTNDGYYILSTENEWYKAAYYNPNAPADPPYSPAKWRMYATQNDMAPGADVPAGGSNSANAYNGHFAVTQLSTKPNVDQSVDYMTDVGAYINSVSHYGTYDQVGNVWEWLESPYNSTDYKTRGASWYDDVSGGAAASGAAHCLATLGIIDLGFRVVSVGVPKSPAMSQLALLVANWLHTCTDPDWCQGADSDQDGIVNFIDFAILAQNWE